MIGNPPLGGSTVGGVVAVGTGAVVGVALGVTV